MIREVLLWRALCEGKEENRRDLPLNKLSTLEEKKI